MPFYAVLCRAFPLSHGNKMSLALGVGYAVALCIAALYQAVSAPLVVGLLAGWAISSGLIQFLLTPIRAINRSVAVWGQTGRVTALPNGVQDDMGQLMARINLLMARAQRSVDTSWSEDQSDLLTGALNMAGAEKVLQDAGAGWLIGFDLAGHDGFVEAQGQASGDKLLLHLTHNMTETVRHDDMVARIRPGRFLIFLPGASGEVADRIVDRIVTRVDLSDAKSLGVDLCFSVARFEGGGEPQEAVARIEAVLASNYGTGASGTRTNTKTGQSAA